jgi:hypothetical protein
VSIPPRTQVTSSGAHAIVVLQDRASPDVGGELVFGKADALALQVLGLLDAVLAHVDRRVAEGSRQEHRHGDVRALAARVLDQVARQRQFGDVEVHASHGPEEHLLGVQEHVDRIHAVDLHAPVEQRTGAVVVAHGDRELQLGHRLRLH